MFATAAKSALSIALAGALAFSPALAGAEPSEGNPARGACLVSEDASEYASGGVLAVMEEGGAKALSAQDDAETLLEAAGDAALSAEEVADGVVLVEAAGAQEALEAAERISALPGVAWVQPDYVYELPEEDLSAGSGAEDGFPASHAVSAEALAAVSDPDRPEQWYLDAIGADEAWDLVRTDGRVTVGMLDTGVRLDHEDLAGNVDAQLAWDAVNGEPMGPEDAGDHGTRVAGIISAAADNGLGVAGASWNARVVPVSVFDENGKASTSSISRGLAYLFDLADEDPQLNLRVVNLSLGGYNASNGGADLLLRRLVGKDAAERDIAVVAAGGNKNRSDELWPSDWDGVLSVTAVARDGVSRAPFSDHNDAKDVCAPGVEILGPDARSASSYSQDEGTSFAAPQVSAVLALMFAASPKLTSERAGEIVCSTAKDLGEPGKDEYFGWGMVDAGAAVAAAVEEAGRPTASYEDVDQGAWYQSPVPYLDFAVSRGLLRGDGAFLRPEDVLTRAEAATVLRRAFVAGAEDGAEASAVPFADVESGQWCTASVNWAWREGVVEGYDNGLFGTDDPVTFEQFCKMLASRLASPEELEAASPGVLDGFSDGDSVSGWASQAVSWCVQEGIVEGWALPDGSRAIAPQESLSRARAAAFLQKADARLGFLADPA